MTPRLPFAQPHPLRAGAELLALQAAGPIHKVLTPVGDEAWLVTGYAEVRSLMDDERLGRSHRSPQTAPRSRASALFGGPIGEFESEPQGHRRMRDLLQPLFSPRRLRTLQVRVQALTAERLDRLADTGQPADLHAVVAHPLPVLVICELLGVPYGDRDRFRVWVDAAAFADDIAESGAGMAALVDYGVGLVTEKRRKPGDDVISALCAHDDLDDVEIAVLTMALLFAGYETTVTQIWAQSVQLLSDRARWQRLLEDPALIPKACEEMLRASLVGGVGIPRWARADISIAGVVIGEGDLVLLDPGSANHDPSAFPDPDVVDFDRLGAPHLSFGFGARYCLGAPLARMELTSVFAQMIPRFPDMRLAVDASALTINTDALASGLVQLPVTWGGG
ncbi:MAG: cytochrome P450 [Mycobacterium sp.]|nr:cytochrome P450 [Mycobacterium sp.]